MSLSGGRGLERQSQLMADKITTVPKSKIRKRVGRLDDQDGHHQARGRRFSAPGRFALSLGITSNVGKHPCRAVKHRWGLCQMRSFERASLVVDCGCFEAMRDRPGSGKPTAQHMLDT